MATQLKLLQAVQTQPDLIDFLEYLQPLLNKIERLQSHLLHTTVINKTTSPSLEASFKLDTVLNKDLPQMVETFCALDFNWRNTAQVKAQNKNLTPKELLLENLSAVSQSVEEIEETLNLKNVSALLAHNLYLNANLNQPAQSIEQTFDYAAYQPSANPLPPLVNLAAEMAPFDAALLYSDLNNTDNASSSDGISIFELVACLAILITILFSAFIVKNHIQDLSETQQLTSELESIPSYAQYYILTKGGYKDEYYTNSPSLSFPELINPNKSPLREPKVPSILETKNFKINFTSSSSYTISYKISNISECHSTAAALAELGDTVQVFSVITNHKPLDVKNNYHVNNSLFANTCMLSGPASPLLVTASRKL